MNSEKTRKALNNGRTKEENTIDVPVDYVRDLRRAVNQKAKKYTYPDGRRTIKVSRDYLKALRKEAGRYIDPETAEVEWVYAQVLDPYGDGPDLPEECQQTGRDYFARSPGSNVWIWFGDLSDATHNRLLEKHEHKLAFPAGFKMTKEEARRYSRILESAGDV
jgi:hypothetical protein